MPSTIFSGSKVKTLKSTLNLNGGADIISSTTDPTSSAVSADPGSLLLNTTSGKMYRKNDSGSSTNWTEVGSSSSFGINYITNPLAATNTTGWSTYADAAGAQPVDGTGGSPNVTWTRSTTTPLRGAADFEFAKDAANRQGQGVATDITIDNADQAKVLTVTFDYEIVSGTYAAGDLTVYLIADPAGTPSVIQPAGYTVQAATATTKMKHIATFQTNATGNTYRVCLHVASTSASAYTLALDNISVGPQVVQYGAPVTDWVSFTPTITNASGVDSLSGYWRRIGDSMHIRAAFRITNVSRSATSDWYMPMPRGTGNANLIPDNGGTSVQGFYEVYGDITGSTNQYVQLDGVKFSSVYNGFTFPRRGTNRVIYDADFNAPGVTKYITLDVIVPVVGWSSSVVMSSDTDTRVIGLAVSRITANQTITAAGGETTIIFQNVKLDSTGSYNSSTGVYTIPVSGKYRISANVRFDTGATAPTAVNTYFQVDGNTSNLYGRWAGNDFVASKNYMITPTALIDLVAGQTVQMRITTTGQDINVSFSSNNFSDISALTIERLSGPSVVAASESCSAKITTSTTTVGTGYTQLIHTNKIWDTHNAYSISSGLYSVPISGKWKVTCFYFTPTQNFTAGNTVSMALFLDGVQIGPSTNEDMAIWYAQGTWTGGRAAVLGTTNINANAGQTLGVKVSQVSSAAIDLTTRQWVMFERIGN